MLNAMVKAAVLWMRNGLNVQHLKLVALRFKVSPDDPITTVFKELKAFYQPGTTISNNQ